MGKGDRAGGLKQGAAPGIRSNPGMVGGAMMPPAAKPDKNKGFSWGNLGQAAASSGMPQRNTRDPGIEMRSPGGGTKTPMDPKTPQRFKQGGAYGSPSTGIQQLMRSYGMGRMWR